MFKNTAYAPKGKNSIVIDPHGLGNDTFSMSLLCTLSDISPVIINLRDESNDQYDFLDFLCYLIEQGNLRKDDILILDNCGVHVAQESKLSLYSNC
jgi:hypothetical protein